MLKIAVYMGINPTPYKASSMRLTAHLVGVFSKLKRCVVRVE